MTITIEQRQQIARAASFAFLEPLRAVWEHGSQACITAAAAYMVTMFSMQHEVLPIQVAIPLAIGFEWTYLRGLATADKTRSGWGMALNIIAMLTSATYGILYILGVYEVIPKAPDQTAAFWLAVAHVAPMTMLSFCYANVRRAHKLEEHKRMVQHSDKRQDWELQQEEADRRFQREQDEKRLKFEQWKEAQRVKHELSQNSVTNTPVTVSQRVTTPQTADRSEQRKPVVTVYKTAPRPINVTQEAARIGISRGMWYKLRDEALNAGELTQEEV